MTLHDELQTISGIGPATADKIVEIVEQHGPTADPTDIEYAIDQARRGNEGEVIAVLESL